jgi:hypothetical protein
MQAGLADIDVVIRRGARTKDELSEPHRAIEQHLAQSIAFAGFHEAPWFAM